MHFVSISFASVTVRKNFVYRTKFIFQENSFSTLVMNLQSKFTQYLHELSVHDEKLDRLQVVLLELGVCHESELVYVKADDLTPVLTTIQARRLTSSWEPIHDIWARQKVRGQ